MFVDSGRICPPTPSGRYVGVAGYSARAGADDQLFHDIYKHLTPSGASTVKVCSPEMNLDLMECA